VKPWMFVGAFVALGAGYYYVTSRAPAATARDPRLDALDGSAQRGNETQTQVFSTIRDVAQAATSLYGDLRAGAGDSVPRQSTQNYTTPAQATGIQTLAQPAPGTQFGGIVSGGYSSLPTYGS
jgi:hypothetical protein